MPTLAESSMQCGPLMRWLCDLLLDPPLVKNWLRQKEYSFELDHIQGFSWSNRSLKNNIDTDAILVWLTFALCYPRFPALQLCPPRNLLKSMLTKNKTVHFVKENGLSLALDCSLGPSTLRKVPFRYFVKQCLIDVSSWLPSLAYMMSLLFINCPCGM